MAASDGSDRRANRGSRLLEERSWFLKREEALKKHGLWEKWGALPPAGMRDKPTEEYLPGGSEYRPPGERGEWPESVTAGARPSEEDGEG